jgi:hypothetical protein
MERYVTVIQANAYFHHLLEVEAVIEVDVPNHAENLMNY